MPKKYVSQTVVVRTTIFLSLVCIYIPPLTANSLIERTVLIGKTCFPYRTTVVQTIHKVL